MIDSRNLNFRRPKFQNHRALAVEIGVRYPHMFHEILSIIKSLHNQKPMFP